MFNVGYEYLGFINRTCDRNPGPMLRTSSAKTWRDWEFQVEKKDGDGNIIASIRPYHPSHFRCRMPLSLSAESECRNEAARKPEMSASDSNLWRLVPLKGTNDVYRIISYSQKSGCYRFLSASSSCTNKEIIAVTKDYGPRQRWKLIKTFDTDNNKNSSVSGGDTIDETDDSSSENNAEDHEGDMANENKPNNDSEELENRLSDEEIGQLLSDSQPTIVFLGAINTSSIYVTFMPPGIGNQDLFSSLKKCIITASPSIISVDVYDLMKPYTGAIVHGLQQSSSYSISVQCLSKKGIKSKVSRSEETLTPMGAAYPGICCGLPQSASVFDFGIIPPSNADSITAYGVRYRQEEDDEVMETQVPIQQEFTFATLNYLRPTKRYRVYVVSYETNRVRIEQSSLGLIAMP